MIGTEKYKKDVREELMRSPLMFGDFEMKEKLQDVYLGDVLSSGGLADSVSATVSLRAGRLKGLISEVAALMIVGKAIQWALKGD